ncbi:hypothetical protein K435DRAFT_875685 [Dendrothele bispora CBS 962.96]|uniref:Uncharacterized protein n=1 Tax=Dendrothele bispora (strain CBS 962.96) TaxID=1314807 RepID=A0A4S8KTS6_DENBC|nr:hypothetical protein K435DRAFT_875685 [Dendrothele bispora CBS 962.96]
MVEVPLNYYQGVNPAILAGMDCMGVQYSKTGGDHPEDSYSESGNGKEWEGIVENDSTNESE